MIVLGLILVLISLFVEIPLLRTIGIILIVVGAILAILGSLDRAVGPRRHYW